MDPIAAIVREAYGYYDSTERSAMKSKIYKYIMEPQVKESL